MADTVIEAGFCNDKIGEYRYTIVLLRPPYAGAEYTTSFSDNFKSRIFTQLFGDEALSGAYKSYSRNHSKTGGCDNKRWIVGIKRPFNIYKSGYYPKNDYAELIKPLKETS